MVQECLGARVTEFFMRSENPDSGKFACKTTSPTKYPTKYPCWFGAFYDILKSALNQKIAPVGSSGPFDGLLYTLPRIELSR